MLQWLRREYGRLFLFNVTQQMVLIGIGRGLIASLGRSGRQSVSSLIIAIGGRGGGATSLRLGWARRDPSLESLNFGGG